MIRALLGIALLAGCGGGSPDAPRRPIAMALPAVDGGELELGAYRGKLVVLHVFTTWSLGATGDVPQLIEVDRADDVVVIGIALDQEGYDLVAPWRAALEVRYLIGLADDRLRAGNTPLGAVAAVPVTIVLDRQGRIARRFDRALTEGELPRVIAELRGTR